MMIDLELECHSWLRIDAKGYLFQLCFSVDSNARPWLSRLAYMSKWEMILNFSKWVLDIPMSTKACSGCSNSYFVSSNYLAISRSQSCCLSSALANFLSRNQAYLIEKSIDWPLSDAVIKTVTTVEGILFEIFVVSFYTSQSMHRNQKAHAIC